MKAIYKGHKFSIVWNIINRSTEKPFDFTGLNVSVGMYSDSCRVPLKTYNIENGTITAQIEPNTLPTGVYNLMCRYASKKEQAYCVYRNAFQITSRQCIGSDVETINLTSVVSHIDSVPEEELPKECQLIAEELFGDKFRLPQLTADRAIADEHGNRIPDTYVTRRMVEGHIKQIYNQQFNENPPLIMEGYITPEMLSKETREMLEATGQEITNLPDGEDLQSIHGVLKFANKKHNPNSYSGLGRQYLRKNIVAGVNVLTQSMIQWPNTIYIIQYDYDLNGATITIPDGCVLDFQGGCINNGELIGNSTLINAPLTKIFGDDLITRGSWNLDKINVEWFGAIGNGTFDSSTAIMNAIRFHNNNNRETFVYGPYDHHRHTTIQFNQGVYRINKSVIYNTGITFKGENSLIVSDLGVETPVFDSGYLVNGNLISNSLLSTQELISKGLCIGVHFENLSFENINYCINNRGVIWQSMVRNCYFNFCGMAIKGDNNFYFQYRDITIYGTKDGNFNKIGKIILGESANRIQFQNVQIGSIAYENDNTRGIGIQITNGGTNISIKDCSFELMHTGIEITGKIVALSIEDIYTEAIQYLCRDTDGVIKENIFIKGIYSYDCACIIKASGLRNSVIYSSTDRKNVLYAGRIELYEGDNSNKAAIYVDDNLIKGVDELAIRFKVYGDIQYIGPNAKNFLQNPLKKETGTIKLDTPSFNNTTCEYSVNSIEHKTLEGNLAVVKIHCKYSNANGSGPLKIILDSSSMPPFDNSEFYLFELVKHDGYTGDNLIVRKEPEYEVLYIRDNLTNLDIQPNGEIIIQGIYSCI